MNEIERKDFEGLETRTFALEFERAEGEEESRTISMSFASEEPVLRSFGWEILSHDRGDIDFDFIGSGRAPLLLSHDPETQIGVVESASLSETERKSRAVVRFGNGSLASEIFRDVQDKIRANISVGYTITELMKQDETRDGHDVYRAKFQPREISVVSIPADTQVGIGRAEKTLIENKKKEVMETKAEIVAETPSFDAEKIVGERLAERAKTNKEILALAKRHNRRDLADQAIANNIELDQFRGQLLSQIESKPLDVPADVVDAPIKDQRKYSLLRALNASSRGTWQEAGFELEMSQEVATRLGKTPQGFFIPDFAWTGSRNEEELAKRTVMTAGTNASGGYFAPTDQLASQWVEALRAKMVLPGLGMKIMSGLTTKISIPKVSAGVSAAFVAEDAAVAAVNQTTGQITMQGKTLGCYEDISRLLLQQSDPSIEAIVRNDILAAVANKIEDVAIEGDSGAEPTGITKTSGIGSVAIGTNGGAPTWASVTNLVKEVETDNAALNASTMGFLSNPKVKSKLSNTAKVSSTDSVMILNDPWNMLYGYQMGVTTNVPSDLTKGSTSGTCSAMIFGDFSQLMLGLFSTPDILIDPYTNGSKGTVRLVVMQEVDVAVRHAESFSACLDYTTV